MVLFSDGVLFAHDLGTNREHTGQAIDQYSARGGTALYDALGDALARLKWVAGRKAVVLLTDGRDEDAPGTAPGSVRTLDDVLRALEAVGATVFPIGLGPRVNRAVLERLARVSGGSARFPDDVSLLGAEFARVLDNLRRRYAIAYQSTNPARDGIWRKVTIRTRLQGTAVSSRGGYYAPAR